MVIADIETRVPMRGVVVSTMSGYRDTTNWRGVCYVPATFDTLNVYKANYLPERLIPKELKDSTYLIPSGRSVSEVTVWGKNHIQDNVNMWGKNVQRPLPSTRTGVIGQFDLGKLLDSRARRDRKHLKRVKGKFTEMEETEDPIVRAYEQAMAEEERKQEQEAAKNKDK